jgi:hypothetical protein
MEKPILKRPSEATSTTPFQARGRQTPMDQLEDGPYELVPLEEPNVEVKLRLSKYDVNTGESVRGVVLMRLHRPMHLLKIGLTLTAREDTNLDRIVGSPVEQGEEKMKDEQPHSAQLPGMSVAESFPGELDSPALPNDKLGVGPSQVTCRLNNEGASLLECVLPLYKFKKALSDGYYKFLFILHIPETFTQSYEYHSPNFSYSVSYELGVDLRSYTKLLWDGSSEAKKKLTIFAAQEQDEQMPQTKKISFIMPSCLCFCRNEYSMVAMMNMSTIALGGEATINVMLNRQMHNAVTGLKISLVEEIKTRKKGKVHEIVLASVIYGKDALTYGVIKSFTLSIPMKGHPSLNSPMALFAHYIEVALLPKSEQMAKTSAMHIKMDVNLALKVPQNAGVKDGVTGIPLDVESRQGMDNSFFEPGKYNEAMLLTQTVKLNPSFTTVQVPPPSIKASGEVNAE